MKSNYQGSTNYNTSNSTTTTITYGLLFYDECNSSTGLSKYGTPIGIEGSGSMNFVYNSTENAYSLTSNGADYNGFIPITSLYGLNNFTLEMDLKVNGSTTEDDIGFAILKNSSNVITQHLNRNYSQLIVRQWLNSSSSFKIQTSVSITSSNYYHLKISVNGTSLTINLLNGTTSLYSNTITLNSTFDASLGTNQYGIWTGWTSGLHGYVKNIKATSN